MQMQLEVFGKLDVTSRGKDPLEGGSARTPADCLLRQSDEDSGLSMNELLKGEIISVTFSSFLRLLRKTKKRYFPAVSVPQIEWVEMLLLPVWRFSLVSL